MSATQAGLRKDRLQQHRSGGMYTLGQCASTHAPRLGSTLQHAGRGGGGSRVTDHAAQGTPGQMREEEEGDEDVHAAAAKSPRPATAPVMRQVWVRLPQAPAARRNRVLPVVPTFPLYHTTT